MNKKFSQTTIPPEIKNKIILVVFIFVLTLSTGLLGYKVLAPQSSALDALYMTVITLSTVGYGEVIDLSGNPMAKIFTMVLILFGMGNLLFVVTAITSFITDGEIQKVLRKRRMLKMIEKIKDHFIVCGNGIMCKKIIEELIETKRAFVLVSTQEDEVKEWAQMHPDLLYVLGDPSHNEILTAAGIGSCKGLMATLLDDKDNLLAVVTAKRLNPHIRIVASVTNPEIIDKFTTVGVETIVSPTLIGGLRLVSEMIRPSVTTFLDVMLRDKSSNIRFEDVVVEENSFLSNQTIEGAHVREKTGLVVIALRKNQDEGFVYNPGEEEVLSVGMSIIVIGDVDKIALLRQLAKNAGSNGR